MIGLDVELSCYVLWWVRVFLPVVVRRDRSVVSSVKTVSQAGTGL